MPDPEGQDAPVLGTPGRPGASRLLLLGAGELGKEITIEAQRLGVEVVAVDRYAGAPAMQVAHRSHVIDMRNPDALRAVLTTERAHWVVPEVEAIATEVLAEFEATGTCVVPTARAAALTMDREGIRRLAAEVLGLPTSPHRFAASIEACRTAAAEVGFPCVVKPVTSSSGKGQRVVRSPAEVDGAFAHALAAARADRGRVIVEGFIDFEYEVTLLTVRHAQGTFCCAPIGHLQVDGDYRESWQPQPMSSTALARAEAMAFAVTGALGGRGLFGVECFVRGDEVWFSEVSPRPHDTGLVTLVSQERSQFALHVRALLGLPVAAPGAVRVAASAAILGDGHSQDLRYGGLATALADPEVELRLFGKPQIAGRRRLGVALARGADVASARARAREAAAAVHIDYG